MDEDDIVGWERAESRERALIESGGDPFGDGGVPSIIEKARAADVARRIENKEAMFWLRVKIKGNLGSGIKALDFRREIGMEDGSSISVTDMHLERIPVTELFARENSPHFDLQAEDSVEIDGFQALKLGLIKPKDKSAGGLGILSVVVDEDIARSYAASIWNKKDL